MEGADPDAVVPILQRVDVLEACTDGSVERAVIAEEVNCSRATAYRATSDLEERSLLERTRQGYRLTGVGDATLERMRAFLLDIDGIERVRPLLDHVDASDLVRHLSLFRDATVLEADEDTPYGIEQHVTSIQEDTNQQIFGMANNIGSPSTVHGAYDQIAAGVDFEYIFTQPAFDRLNTQFSTVNADAMERANSAYYVVEDVEFNFVVYDDTLVVVGFDAGHISVVVTTDNPEAVEWSRRRFERHRRRSEQVA